MHYLRALFKLRSDDLKHGHGSRPVYVTHSRALWLIERELERFYRADPDAKRTPADLKRSLLSSFVPSQGERPIEPHEIDLVILRVKRRLGLRT